MTTPPPTDELLSAWLMGDLDDPESEQVARLVESDPQVAARADRVADLLWRLAAPPMPAAPVGLADRITAGVLARADRPIAGGAAPAEREGAPPPLRGRPRTPRTAGSPRRSRADRVLGVMAALVLLTAVSTVGLRAFREPPLTQPDTVGATDGSRLPATDGSRLPATDGDVGAPPEATSAEQTPSADGLGTEPGPSTSPGSSVGTGAGQGDAAAPGPPPPVVAGSSGDGGQGGPSGPAAPPAADPDPGAAADPDPGAAADPDPGAGAGPGEQPEPPEPPAGEPSDGSGGQPDDSTAAGDVTPPSPDDGAEGATSPAPEDGTSPAPEGGASPAPEGDASPATGGGAPVESLGAEEPTIADSQQPLADDDEVRAYFGDRPESAHVAGLSGDEAQDRAAAYAQAVRDAGDFPSGDQPDRCLDEVLSGTDTAVVVAVETVTYEDQPGLAYLVVRGADQLDHADVTVVGVGSCTPLTALDVPL